MNKFTVKATIFLIFIITNAWTQKLLNAPTVSLYAKNTDISKKFLTGRFDYRRDTSFIKVSPICSENTVYLKKEAYQSFIKMYKAAQKDGVQLTILSGTRSFTDQRYKWENKWHTSQFADYKDKKEKISGLLRYWSMPGTSRHHWGTDVDLTNLNLSFYKTRQGIKMYNWLKKNAASYGFYQPFNAGRTTGYREEKWHWSYLPLAKVYLTEYVKQINYTDITGFEGCQMASAADVINTRVLAINPECK